MPADPRLHDGSRPARTSRLVGGFGNVFGPTVNNTSKREAVRRHRSRPTSGNHEIKVGGDYQKDTTFGHDLLHGRAARPHPSLPAGPATSICDLGAGAVLHERRRRHAPGLLPARPAGRRHDRRLPDHRRVAVQHADQALQRLHPGPVADHPDADRQRRRPLRHGELLRLSPDPTIGAFKAFSLTNQWSPRVGFVWDFAGDGTSKLYASAGRFFYALPTDLNVRVFTANSAVQTYNYDPDSIVQDRAERARAPRTSRAASRRGEPVDGWTTASSQRDSAHQGVLPGRAHARRREGSRSDALDRPQGHLPHPRPHGRGPLRPRLHDRCPGLDLRSLQPGRRRPGGVGRVPDLQRLGQPDGPDRRRLLGDRRSGRRCQAHLPRHRAGRPQAVHQRALGAGFVPVLVAEGQLLGRHPRGLGPDGPRHQRRLRLLPVHLQRLRQPRARPAVPGPHRRGLQRAVRSLGRRSSSTSAAVCRPRASATSTTSTRTSSTSSSAATRGRTPDRLRHEPLARLQHQRRPGDDHAAGSTSSTSSTGRRRRPSTRSFNLERHRFVDGSDQPVLRPGRASSPGRRAPARSAAHRALHGQPGLPQDHWRRPTRGSSASRSRSPSSTPVSIRCLWGRLRPPPFFW